MGFWDWVIVVVLVPSPSLTGAYVGGYTAGSGSGGTPGQGVAGGGGGTGDRSPRRLK